MFAVEIDENAAQTAETNFAGSPFSNRIHLFHSPIENYLLNDDGEYDLIVSNPPFFINSLKSENPIKGLARHTNLSFFENLLKNQDISKTEIRSTKSQFNIKKYKKKPPRDTHHCVSRLN